MGERTEGFIQNIMKTTPETKDKIKALMSLLNEFKATVHIKYFPFEHLQSVEELYGLYYGGGTPIRISSVLDIGNDHVKITGENMDEVCERLAKTLEDDILGEIIQALDNLSWEAEELKYFDRSIEKHEIFKKEVMRLKEGDSNLPPRKFTKEEVLKLKARYPKNVGYVVDDNGVFMSTNQGFGHFSISRNEDGRVSKSWSTPQNVDPDDAKVGYYDRGSVYYDSTDDLLNDKPVKKSKDDDKT